jgi:HlyD family secretion protein
VARKSVLTNDPVSDTDARVVEVRVTLAPQSAARVVRLANARVEVTIDITEPSPAQPDRDQPETDQPKTSAAPPTSSSAPLATPRP